MDHALLVGINKYPYPNELNGCLNDLVDMQAFLLKRCSFDAAGIQFIRDTDATSSNIKAALRKMVEGLKPYDRFLFHYSGHGAQLEEGNAASDVICPVDFDFTPETSVTVQDFHDIFSKIPKDVCGLWLSDSCHSGDLERDFYRNGVPKMFRARRTGPRKISTHTFKSILADLPQIALISGCKSSQTSADADFDGRFNGAFTRYLLDTLATCGMSLPLTSLVSQVQLALKAHRYKQVPQLTGPPEQVQHTFLQPHGPAEAADKPNLRTVIQTFAAATGLHYREQGSSVVLQGNGPTVSGTLTFRG